MATPLTGRPLSDEIVLDRLRPEGDRDPHGVGKAHETLGKTYDWLDGEMASRE